MGQFQLGNPGGPGRPKNTDKFAGVITKADARIAKNLIRYIENMEALADGIYTEEKTEEGARLVYQRPPDRQSNEYLINRIMGKPTERKELSGPDGGPVEIADARSQLSTILSDTLARRHTSGADGSDTGIASSDGDSASS